MAKPLWCKLDDAKYMVGVLLLKRGSVCDNCDIIEQCQDFGMDFTSQRSLCVNEKAFFLLRM